VRVSKERVKAQLVVVGMIGLMFVALSSALPVGAAPTVSEHVVSTAGPTGTPAVTSVACISVGNCVVAGYGSGDQAFVRAERSGHWSRAINPIKNLGKVIGSSLYTLSCFRDGCLIFGEFTPSKGSQTIAHFTVSYSGGTWHKAKLAALPLGSAKGFDESGISCEDSRDCVVVGRLPYSDNSVSVSDFVSAPAVLTMTNGVWRSPTLIGAKTAGLPPSSFSDLSCPSWGNCVAVGIGKVDGHFRSIEATETNGAWSPVTSPFPKGWDVLSVSCPTTVHCTVGGSINSASRGEAFVSSEQSGLWLHAVQVGTAWTVKTGYSGSSANLLFCASATTCVVAGMVDGPRATMNGKFSVSSVAWVANETGGRWNAGAMIGYRAGKINEGQVDDLSCPSATSCVAVGQSGIKNSKMFQIGRADNFVATVTP